MVSPPQSSLQVPPSLRGGSAGDCCSSHCSVLALQAPSSTQGTHSPTSSPRPYVQSPPECSPQDADSLGISNSTWHPSSVPLIASYPCPLGKVPILLSVNLTSSRHEGSAFRPLRPGPGCSSARKADLPPTSLLLFGASAWPPPPPDAHIDCLTLPGIPLSSGLLSSAIHCPRTKTTSQKAAFQTWNTSNHGLDTLAVCLFPIPQTGHCTPHARQGSQENEMR